MPIREMTLEEKAEFDRKHPLGTMLIFRARQTPLATTQPAAESCVPKSFNSYVTQPDGTPSSNRPPSQEEIEANDRLCEAEYRYVMEHCQPKT